MRSILTTFEKVEEKEILREHKGQREQFFLLMTIEVQLYMYIYFHSITKIVNQHNVIIYILYENLNAITKGYLGVVLTI